MSSPNKKEERSLEDIIAATKTNIDEICYFEREAVKGLFWDLYSEYGMHPHQMRLAFNEVIELIEKKEAEYAEEDEEGASTSQ